jgi:uncharacterized protein YeaO (DUF488 family)
MLRLKVETVMLSFSLRDVNLPAAPASMLKVKRIYELAAPSDGYRVLVDRLWPRGINKNTARVDLWLKEIAPSSALRKWFAHDPARWTQFRRRYGIELRANPQRVARLKTLLRQHRTVTLLFGARDEQHNQAVALRAFLRGRK